VPHPTCCTLFPYTTLFRSDRFVPPDIPFFSEHKETQPAITQPAQTQQVPIQPQHQVIENPQSYGPYYYTDLYDNIPNVPQIPERSEEHTSELQSQSNLVCR